MATGALITAEKYLATHFDREPEFVHGELVERALPNLAHSRTQQRLCVAFGQLGYACINLSLKLAADHYRIADFVLFECEPEGDIPRVPPLLIIEIGSPDDRVLDIEQKLDDYRTWGVAHVWFVEPELKKLYVYERGLVHVQQLDLPRFNLTITPDHLFS